MALSRRNILIGLGALVGGGGALVGTGAFTTVSAERSVDVSTAGDADAFLQIEDDSSYVQGGDNDALQINLDADGGNTDADSGFNDEAVTELAGVIRITNNAADESTATIGLSTEAADSASASGSVTVTVDDGDSGNSNVADIEVLVSNNAGDFDGSTTDLAVGETAYLDVRVDTRDDSISGVDANEITIVANESTADQGVTDTPTS
ncbi:hypothetical protein [Halobellus rubicundus]|uniref:DUF1102 domain-containing protein n=1 Tax=Halobellus rubicundus TaxID=2996466 RepID=A0ABD5MF70_9EURY